MFNIKNKCPLVIVASSAISKADVKEVLDVEDDDIEIVQVGGANSKTAIVQVGENVPIIGSSQYVLSTTYDYHNQLNTDSFDCPRAAIPGLLFWSFQGP